MIKLPFTVLTNWQIYFLIGIRTITFIYNWKIFDLPHHKFDVTHWCKVWSNNVCLYSAYCPIWVCPSGLAAYRDGKMYKRASDACVNFLLACIKYVLSFMLFCRKSELCCDIVFLGVILMAFNLVSFYFKRNKLNLPHNFCLYRFVAVLFCSYLFSTTFYGVFFAYSLLSKFTHFFG